MVDEASGASEWVDRIFLYDGGGSVRALTDLEGNITDTFSYDAYGNLLGYSLSAIGDCPTFYLYRGERWDADLGQYYLRARFYNSDLGRFHTLDEYEGRTGEPLSLHKYLYAHANPVTGWDPSGQSLLTVMSDLALRVFVTVSLSCPKTVLFVGFVASMLIPTEISIGLPAVNLGGVARMGLGSAWKATKALPSMLRAYNTAKAAGNLPKLGSVGKAWEAWVIKNLNLTKNTKNFKAGAKVAGTPKGSTVPDVYDYKDSIMEIKSGAITSRVISQAKEIAEIAKNEGRGMTYVFMKHPGDAGVSSLRNAIASVDSNIDVAVNVMIPMP